MYSPTSVYIFMYEILNVPLYGLHVRHVFFECVVFITQSEPHDGESPLFPLPFFDGKFSSPIHNGGEVRLGGFVCVYCVSVFGVEVFVFFRGCFVFYGGFDADEWIYTIEGVFVLLGFIFLHLWAMTRCLLMLSL
jgi:hypothetical protein